MKKFRGQVFLTNLSKPLVVHQTKVCTIKEVCGGVPLSKDKFYPGASACKDCIKAKSKRKWSEKKKSDIFF